MSRLLSNRLGLGDGELLDLVGDGGVRGNREDTAESEGEGEGFGEFERGHEGVKKQLFCVGGKFQGWDF